LLGLFDRAISIPGLDPMDRIERLYSITVTEEGSNTGFRNII